MLHLGEDEVRRPVDDPEHAVDVRDDERLAQHLDHRDRRADRRLEAELDAAVGRGREELGAAVRRPAACSRSRPASPRGGARARSRRPARARPSPRRRRRSPGRRGSRRSRSWSRRPRRGPFPGRGRARARPAAGGRSPARCRPPARAGAGRRRSRPSRSRAGQPERRLPPCPTLSQPRRARASPSHCTAMPPTRVGEYPYPYGDRATHDVRSCRSAPILGLSMIVAHLDLDAFFAAVEELEDPALRRRPLVVGGDPHGRGVVATANYVARPVRDPLGDELRRGAAPLPGRGLRPAAPRALPRSTRRPSGARSARSSRRSSRPGSTRATSTSARSHATSSPPGSVAEAVQAAVRGATSLTCSLGVATCKVVAKVASDRRKPGGLTVVRPGREAAFLAPFDVRLLPGVGPRAEERLRDGERRRRSAPSPRSTTTHSAGCSRARSGRLLRDRARGIDPRGLETQVERISISTEETFERDIADREQLHAELRRMAGRLGDHLTTDGPGGADGDDEGALPGLLDPQPLVDARGRPRRRRGDRRHRLRAARPRARRPAGAAPPRRRRPLEPRAVPAARALR